VPTVVNTHEAKTHLSRLLERVRQGEEIIIARGGKPVAKLVPVEEERKGKRILGQGRGLIKFLPGWDDPMTEEELAEWYDSPIFPDEAPES
jgi:prevent-host-death family protein